MNETYTFQQEPLLIVISGPAGVGKDTVLNRLKQADHPFHFVVTATDRPPRPDEVDGVDYFFVSTAAFVDMIEQGELLEHAIVYGQNKGVPKQQVRLALASGKDVVMRIDVQGASTIKRLVPEAILIFLTASSLEELEQRLRQRGGDSSEQIQKRLNTAQAEIESMPNFDYYVVNRTGKLDQTIADIMAIVRAEHCRTQPRVVTL